MQEAGCTSCVTVEPKTSLQVLNSMHVLNSLERQVRHEITNAKPEFWQPFGVSKQAKRTSTTLGGKKNKTQNLFL